MPWRAVLTLGVGCVIAGVWLLAAPFSSLSVLAGLVAAAMVLSGLAEISSAEASPRPMLLRFIGVVWIMVGVVAVVWPGITILGLAVAVGIALLAGGAVRMVTAVAGDGDERFILALSGLTNVIVGVLALTWPAVTVLVIAVLVGVRTVLFGISQIALAVKLRQGPLDPTKSKSEPRRWPRWVRLVGVSLTLVLALAGLAISVAVNRAAPDEPGPFYTAPSPLPEGPTGTIIRTEIINGFRDGATTYRVLYTSTGYDGSPTAVSGIIVVPDGVVPPKGRNVVAFTHGTVGVATNCSPSLRGSKALPVYEGLDDFLGAGYVVAATDYQGLGTKGPHPYLIGKAEAMNALDIVRAAHNLVDAHAGTDFAVWGHSQGGHASLWTGQLAASYAPDLHLVGVAAGAPVSNFVELFRVNADTTVGKILISMTIQSWSSVYNKAVDEIVTPAARPVVTKIAQRCLYDASQILASAPSSLVLGLTFLKAPPWEVEPWKTIVADNTPGGSPTGVPILITQGSDDPIVDPAVTAQFVSDLCANGETVKYQIIPGEAHLEAGQVAAPDVATWIAERFDGKPAPNTCSTS